MRSAVERDLAGRSDSPDALSATVVIDLAKRLCGVAAGNLAPLHEPISICQLVAPASLPAVQHLCRVAAHESPAVRQRVEWIASDADKLTPFSTANASSSANSC